MVLLIYSNNNKTKIQLNNRNNNRIKINISNNKIKVLINKSNKKFKIVKIILLLNKRNKNIIAVNKNQISRVSFNQIKKILLHLIIKKCPILLQKKRLDLKKKNFDGVYYFYFNL